MNILEETFWREHFGGDLAGESDKRAVGWLVGVHIGGELET